MQNTYQIKRDGETLVARLVENGERSVELTYRNARGDTQVGLYKNKMEVSTRATLAGGDKAVSVSKSNILLHGYLVAYDKLGPELREQIPSDWHAVLGNWLAPKEE